MIDALYNLGPRVLFIIAAILLLIVAIIAAYAAMRQRDLEHRMDVVAHERQNLSKAAAESLSGPKSEYQELIKKVVDLLNLRSHLGVGKAKPLLVSAGFRGPQAELTFLFARLMCGILFFIGGLILIFFVFELKVTRPVAVIMSVFIGFAGLWAPHVWVKNNLDKRQNQIKKAWPDCLDLLLICVDSGMSIEQAFRRVADEIGAQSVALAEELTLTTAELSYLPNRRMAYENFSKRINMEIARNLSLSLIQAEKYGTPVGNTLRVLAQESRDMRLIEAERKAAALSVKLTIPALIFFFFPVFVVILVPVTIKLLDITSK